MDAFIHSFNACCHASRWVEACSLESVIIIITKRRSEINPTQITYLALSTHVEKCTSTDQAKAAAAAAVRALLDYMCS